MIGWMLFLHLTGLFAWLGALLAIVVMLTLLKEQLGTAPGNTLAKRVIRVFSTIAHPSAVAVLISGIVLIVQMNWGANKPFWLQVMEKGGGTLILLALIVTGIMGSKLKKRLTATVAGAATVAGTAAVAGAAKPADGDAQTVKLSGYLTTLTVCIVLVVAIVLVVSLRL